MGVLDSESFYNALNDPYLHLNEYTHRYIHPKSKEMLDSLFSKALKKGKQLSAYDIGSRVNEPIYPSVCYLKSKPNWGDVLSCNGDYINLPNNNNSNNKYWRLLNGIGGYVLRSRYVMAGILGLHHSDLPSWLEVHHIDKKTTNDNEENLFLACKLLHSCIHSQFYANNEIFFQVSFEVLYVYSIRFIFKMIDTYSLFLRLKKTNEGCGRSTFYYEDISIEIQDINDKEKIKQEILVLKCNFILLQKLFVSRKERGIR